MRNLVLYEDYSREEVHNLYSPNSRFLKQRGLWGIHGLIPMPDRSGDYVFFVTYGQEQGDHKFEEGITKNGILTWQSQPRQDLQNRRIIELINHDETKNSIYLFLRTKKGVDYTYLGKLRYLSHNSEMENPVYFKWQILNWAISNNVLDRMNLEFVLSQETTDSQDIPENFGIIEVNQPPENTERKGKKSSSFWRITRVDYPELDSRNRELGLYGEMLVIDYEKNNLKMNNCEELAKMVIHTAIVEGDGAGYDILSYNTNGNKKYIEVKTTQGTKNSPFYISRNELEFSIEHEGDYLIYRVYDFNNDSNTGKLYILSGDIEEKVNLTPIQFRASFK